MTDDLFERITGVRGAWRDLGGRGLLRATGADRVRFLNGMVSNDVAALEPGGGQLALLLDRKGKILADLELLAESDGLLLDLSPGRAPVAREALERHVIADDVVFEDLAPRLGQLSLEGPAAREAARALGAPELEPHSHAAGSDAEVVWRAGGSLGLAGVRAIAPRTRIAELVRASGLPELEPLPGEILRIEAFLPAYGIDFSADQFPAEARLERAISFEKGCYVGQEFVARIRSRGAVNRLLVKLSCTAPVEPGATIQAKGRRAGTVTSAALSPVSGPLALGYVRRELAVPGTALEIGGAPAQVLGPPLEPEA